MSDEGADTGTPASDQASDQARERVELLEHYLLGDSPSLTGPEVAERAGIDLETARSRWRALGFSSVGDDEVAFTEVDVRALQLTRELVEKGLITEAAEGALVRTLGRAFSRLAEWQMGLVGEVVDLAEATTEELSELVGSTTPIVEEIQSYVWRRQTLAAASRLMLAPTATGEPVSLAVGFADIVGYTRQSRSLDPDGLGGLVEEFEGEAQRILSDHGGRVIKSIGDEILFVLDDPVSLARASLTLLERHHQDEDFPELRVGGAWGPVLSRLGDVFGPVVNLASRLTSVARPGTLVVDRDLAAALREDEAASAELSLRRLPRTSVKGYRHLEPWTVRRVDSSRSDRAS